jgi:hypothetical protein
MQRCKLIAPGKYLERTWKFEPMSLGYFELKKCKPCFDKGCSKFVDQRQQVKLQWLQVVSEI